MAKLITVSENLLEDILPHLKGTPLEKKITDLIENTGKYRRGLFSRRLENQTQNIALRFCVAKRQGSERSEWSLFPKRS